MKSEAIRALEQALGYEFKNTELIIEALTHRSHHHEYRDSRHNERLEFLGDAVLDLCMTETVMAFSPLSEEGELSKLRSQLVSERTLASAARQINLGRVIRLGRGEDLSGGRDRDALLADTLEAIVAAIYLDSDISVVRNVINEMMGQLVKGKEYLPEALQRMLSRDFKSRLQELCQSIGFGAPTYECLATSGPDHQCQFTMAIKIQGIEIIRADGPTKKEATQEAARGFLEAYGNAEVLEDFLKSKNIEPISKLKNKSKNGSGASTGASVQESARHK